MDLKNQEQFAAEKILTRFREIRKEDPKQSPKEALAKARKDIASQLPDHSDILDLTVWEAIVLGLSINALYDFIVWSLRDLPNIISPALFKRSINKSENPIVISSNKKSKFDHVLDPESRRKEYVFSLIDFNLIDPNLEPKPDVVANNTKDEKLKILILAMSITSEKIKELSNLKRKLVFVMMPSGNHSEYSGKIKESDFIFERIICLAVKKAIGDDVNIVRDTDNQNPGAITRDLIQNIASADICIVDVTGLNPNVFLELGVRYALRRSITILLRQSDVMLPFDITDYRCVEYSPYGPAKAVDDIAAAMQVAMAPATRDSDSLVFNVIPGLQVEIPGVVDSDTNTDMINTVMPWSVYWNQFEAVVGRLSDVVYDGVFVPQAVLGISNGGLIYADLLGRHLFHGIPILSLWANRTKKDNFFNNSVNEGVISGIQSCGKKTSKNMILLVDDIIASGGTLKQAVKYLNERLPKWSVYYLPLFSRNENHVEITKEHLVWLTLPAFKNKMELSEIEEIHAAEIPLLPYKKRIRST